MYYVAIDLETTGSDPTTCDVVEMGAVVFDSDGVVCDSRRWDTIFDPTKMEDGALELHGIRQPVPGAVPMSEAVQDLLQWVLDWTMGEKVTIIGEKATIIGHNFSQFDLPIIMRHVGKAQWDNVFLYRVADTSATGLMLVAAGIMESASLGKQCEFFDITNTRPHRALDDALAEGKLFFAQSKLIKEISANTFAKGEAPKMVPEGVSYRDDPGLVALQGIFQEAFAQVSSGKGEERHGNGMGFFDQPWVALSRTHGVGFLTGQAEKKLMESCGLPTEERRTRERLGVIVYTAMSILRDRGAVE